MREVRGKCDACGHRSAVRDGEATDGRPKYLCLNGNCNQTWTNGLLGEPWDTAGRKQKKVSP